MRAQAFAAVAAALVLGGCITQDVHLPPRDANPALSRHGSASGCRLPPFELVDARSHKGLGWIGGHELPYPERESWLHTAIGAAGPSEPSAAPLRVEISRAYIESHPSGHSFQLVLRVQDGSTESAPRVYRGSESGVTWWGTNAEFGRYVKSAASKAVTALMRGEADCGTD